MGEFERVEIRKVKYRQHAILYKWINNKTYKTSWIFETAKETRDYEEFDLITVLDDLSMDGFELVCGSDDEYVLRTKEDIEEEQEIFHDD